MNKEVLLLNTAFIDRGSYEFLARMNLGGELSPTAKIIWDEISRYYNKDQEAEACDLEILQARIDREYEKHAELLHGITVQFSENISIPNILEEYKDLKQENIGNDLSALLIEPTELNRRKISELMEEYQNVEDSVKAMYDTPLIFGAHPDYFMDDVIGGSMVKLYPRVVNEKIGGGVPRGTHILVFARPEAGKSLISINFAYGFCKEGHKTLYVGNEDPAAVMWNRLMCRFSGMNKFEVLRNKPKAYEKAVANGYEKLAFVHMSPGSVGEIERIVRQEADRGEPFECIVIDQLRNLQARSQNRVEGLEETAIGVRGIAQRHNLVAISVTQAGDSADGKLELTMGDVDFSNTGIPAQVDVMIGVGVNPEFERGGVRMLSFPKNKLSGDHTGCHVRVFTDTSKAVSE